MPEPTRFCYLCGKRHNGAEHCSGCGTLVNPSQDAYFTQEECASCGKPVPRWARFCPYCAAQQKKNDDASYPKQWKQYTRRSIAASGIWTLAAVLAALLLPGYISWLNQTYTAIGAILIIAGLWITSITSIRKGKYWDGTVTGFSTEPSTKKITDASGELQEVPCTIYKTQILWDNGKSLERSEKDNGADHEQLKVGDRVRLYDGINRFAKL